jgi:hypothetical protein
MASPFPPLDQPLWDQAGEALNRRREQRLAVGSVLRAVPPGQVPGAWFSADILDISHGGLALLLSSSAAFSPRAALLLDVSNHPGFGRVRLPATLRWSTAADGLGALQVIGVQLDQPLPLVPPLVQSRK